MPAREIMTRNVVSVTPETAVPDVAAALITHQISGVPVLDPASQVVGITSEGDLYRRLELSTERPRRRWAELFTSNASLARRQASDHDVATRPVTGTSLF